MVLLQLHPFMEAFAFGNKSHGASQEGRRDRTSIRNVKDKLGEARGRGLLLENSTASQDPPNVSSSNDSIQAEAETQPLAEVLVDPALLWDHFFSGIMDNTADAVEDIAVEHGEVFCHPLEVRHAKKRGEWRFNDICNFPLKLNLTPLRGRSIANTFTSILETHFGPLHVSLQLGGVVLEWNDTNLVIPHPCAYEDQVVQLDMQPHSEWVEYIAEYYTTMRTAAQELDFPKQIELTYKIAVKKKDLIINALIRLVVRYNSHFYYDVIYRNSQCFVLDALHMLQVSIPKGLSGGLRKYYDCLVRGRTPSLPDWYQFKSHSDLDEYVMRKVTITDMPQHDLEFILALYFRFHLESKSKLTTERKALDEWQCAESHCCMEEVEKHIDIKSMKIHNFNECNVN